MTQVGNAVLDGEEIVIRAPLSAVIEMAESKYDVEVTDRKAFTDELMADLRKDPVVILADVAGSLVQDLGSKAAFARRL